MTKLKTESWQRLMADVDFPRVDIFLAQALPGMSRARAQKLMEQGLVRMNGKAARPSQKIRAGMVVEYHIPVDPKPTALEAEEIPLQILFEDEQLIAVDKPAGMVVHPAHGNWSGTLVNALLKHCEGKLGKGSFHIGGELRPGIVHRIDKHTSGVLVVAKNDAAFAMLAPQFKNHSITRRYHGICWGRLPASGEWNGSIARDPKQRKRMAIVESGKHAVTKFRALEYFPHATYFEAELHTGRTHQIRVHFSAAGFPLVGDGTYANATRAARKTQFQNLRALQKHHPAFADALHALTQENKRQMLHAQYLKIARTAPKKNLELAAELPPDMREALEIFRSIKKMDAKK